MKLLKEIFITRHDKKNKKKQVDTDNKNKLGKKYLQNKNGYFIFENLAN